MRECDNCTSDLNTCKECKTKNTIRKFKKMHFSETEATTAKTVSGEQMLFAPTTQQQQPFQAIPPPPPTPWNLNTMPWKLASTGLGQNGVMQFSAHVSDDDTAAHSRMALHQKRKSDTNNPIPVKQFISEEKITAHFNGLHISSDYIQNISSESNNTMSGDDMPSTSSGKCFTNLTYHDYQITAKELEQKLRNANRITLCDELKRYQEKDLKANILPEALLNRIEKPCTALVLWQPPPVLQLLHRKKENELLTLNSASNSSAINRFATCGIVDTGSMCDDIEEETRDPDSELAEIDDFVDNNNTCRLDFNSVKVDDMDEDL